MPRAYAITVTPLMILALSLMPPLRYCHTYAIAAGYYYAITLRADTPLLLMPPALRQRAILRALRYAATADKRADIKICYIDSRHMARCYQERPLLRYAYATDGHIEYTTFTPLHYEATHCCFIRQGRRYQIDYQNLRHAMLLTGYADDTPLLIHCR